MARSDGEITAWALAAGRGDRDAMVAFVRATQRDVLGLVRALGDPGQAEDLAQETYLRAVRSLPNFAAQAPARLWLLSIARRVAADAVRRARVRPRVDQGVDWADPVGVQGLVEPAPESEIVLWALVADLDDARREAFVLTQVVGLAYAEAAEVIGCPIGTVRSRVARAREDLAGALRDSPRRRRGA